MGIRDVAHGVVAVMPRGTIDQTPRTRKSNLQSNRRYDRGRRKTPYISRRIWRGWTLADVPPRGSVRLLQNRRAVLRGAVGRARAVLALLELKRLAEVVRGPGVGAAVGEGV